MPPPDFARRFPPRVSHHGQRVGRAQDASAARGYLCAGQRGWNHREGIRYQTIRMKRYLTAIAILPLVFAIGGLLAYIATKYEEIETKDKERQ